MRMKGEKREPEDDKEEKKVLEYDRRKKVLSFPGLTGESAREMSGTSPNMTIIYLSLSALSRQSRDPRVKPEDDEEEKKVSEHDRRKKRLGHGGRGNRADRGFVRGCKRN